MKCDKHTMLLYAVTDRAWVGEQTLYQQVESALKGGVTCVQLREKALDEAAKANPWAFGEDTPTPAPAPGYPVLPGGGEPRHLPSEKDGVTAAFMDRNPGLKI